MQTLRAVIAGSKRAHREDAHDLGEAGGLAAAHGTPQVAEEVGRQLLEGLALGRTELLHDEAVVARLGEEAVALAPARLPPARSFRQASGSSNNHPSRGKKLLLLPCAIPTCRQLTLLRLHEELLQVPACRCHLLHIRVQKPLSCMPGPASSCATMERDSREGWLCATRNLAQSTMTDLWHLLRLAQKAASPPHSLRQIRRSSANCAGNQTVTCSITHAMIFQGDRF